MASLTRNQIKDVVIKSLKTIADIPDNVEAAALANMVAMHQEVFLSALKTNLNALPYIMDDGTTSNAAYYDADLTSDTIKLWTTVGDCIDWITKNQSVVYN